MRAQGFLSWAEDYIASNPGLTAQEIAQTCLARGIVTSGAGNPLGSLVATLHKHHLDHGKIVRRRGPGERAYRYYPRKAQSQAVDARSGTAPSDRLTPEHLQKLRCIANALVDLGKFKNHADALDWLTQN